MIFNKFFLFFAIAASTAGTTNLHAQGDIEAINFSGGNFPVFIPGFIDDSSIGWAFSSSQDIVVDSLGYLYPGSPSLPSQVVSAGLWSTDGTLLRSAVIDNQGLSLNGNFYEPISPLLVAAGSTFVIAIGTSGNIGFNSPPTSYLQQPINYLGWAYLSGSGFTFPTLQSHVDDPDMLLGATFLFQPVPEPSFLGLFALGSFFLAWYRWRKFST